MHSLIHARVKDELINIKSSLEHNKPKEHFGYLTIVEYHLRRNKIDLGDIEFARCFAKLAIAMNSNPPAKMKCKG